MGSSKLERSGLERVGVDSISISWEVITCPVSAVVDSGTGGVVTIAATKGTAHGVVIISGIGSGQFRVV